MILGICSYSLCNILFESKRIPSLIKVFQYCYRTLYRQYSLQYLFHQHGTSWDNWNNIGDILAIPLRLVFIKLPLVKMNQNALTVLVKVKSNFIINTRFFVEHIVAHIVSSLTIPVGLRWAFWPPNQLYHNNFFKKKV